MKKIKPELYLTRASELKVEPNFFMSVPYVLISGLKARSKDGWIWLNDSQWCVFPPLPLGDSNIDYCAKKIWAMFADAQPHVDRGYKFLDWQYIFRPSDFLEMIGGQWETFRKNSRKWHRENSGWTYSLKEPSLKIGGELIGQWLQVRQYSVEDAELIARFAIFAQISGVYRKFLYNTTGELVGINAWDENWKYINYRVCIVKQGEPYLDEFMRWLFYTDNDILQSGKLVNDGGTLGNKGLERFKDKLNPVSKTQIYSYVMEDKDAT